jgi:hypothetical protein
MKALELFVVAAIAGLGFTIGVVTVLGWVLIIRNWVQPAAKALTLTF